MADKAPADPAPDWTGHTMAERIHSCRMMLRMHGFLTDAESERVKVKQVKRGMVPEDAIVVMPRPPQPPGPDPQPGPKGRARRKGKEGGT